MGHALMVSLVKRSIYRFTSKNKVKSGWERHLSILTSGPHMGVYGQAHLHAHTHVCVHTQHTQTYTDSGDAGEQAAEHWCSRRQLGWESDHLGSTPARESVLNASIPLPGWTSFRSYKMKALDWASLGLGLSLHLSHSKLSQPEVS